MKENKRGTWSQALFSISLPIFIVFTLRWLLIEPYVIPSGSMIPTLLVHDHILVNKLAYGLRLPFTEIALVKWAQPKRGDIVVFKYPLEKETFYVKRVIGTPGDLIELKHGVLHVNGVPIEIKKTPPKVLAPIVRSLETDSFDYFLEEGRWIRYYKDHQVDASYGPVKVPAGKYFMMGDNRDQSSDSRVWGFVEESYILGRTTRIWLSCEETLPTAAFICDPSTIRWSRILMGVEP